MSDVNYSDDPSALTPASLAAIRNRLQPQVMLQPVDHDPFAEVPGVGVVPTAVPAAARAVGEGMASWAAAPGNFYRGQQPQVPGQRSDVDEARAQLNASGQYQWGPETATMMVGGGSPFAEAGAVGAAGGGIRAFHGSPYDFERFDLSKIGTGEGAQAYGHGLYFAENPAVAQSYKESLEQPTATGVLDKVSGETISRDELVNKIRQETGAVKAPSDLIQGWTESAANRLLNNQPGIPEYASNFSGDERKALEHIFTTASRFEPQYQRGKTYEVNINADPEHFLDWDKPLSEQHQKIKDFLAGPMFERNLEQEPGWSKLTGEQLYNAVGQRVSGTKQETTQALRDAGIPGIKYLDQGSRISDADKLDAADLDSKIAYQQRTLDAMKGASSRPEVTNAFSGDEISNSISKQETLVADLQAKRGAHRINRPQTSNYVVFNDKLIDIVKKYGLAGLIAGGGAHFSLQPTDAQPEFE